MLGAAGAHVGDFGGDGGGVVAVHEVGVALGGDEVFCGFGFAAGVEGGAGLQGKLLVEGSTRCSPSLALRHCDLRDDVPSR